MNASKAAGVLLIAEHDTTWSQLPADTPQAAGHHLRHLLMPRPERIALTPGAALWVGNRELRRGQPNVLGSALLMFLHLPIEQLLGPALLTGWTGRLPAPLTEAQRRAFTSVLHSLLTMPDYLALHRQAGQLAASWLRPSPCDTTDRSRP